jgi:ribonucleoside-diphosphate reductase alpha subunit
MFVKKRDGTTEPMLFDKITKRNQNLSEDLDIDPTSLSMSVIQGLRTGMTTREIDSLSCESAIYKSTYEPNYAILASRIAVNDLHKTTPSTFKECVQLLHSNVNKVNDAVYYNPLIDELVYQFALKYMDRIEQEIRHQNDYNYSYFGFKTLEKSYLQRVNGKIVERPQYMLMRVALGIHGPSNRNGIVHEGDIDLALETYRELSAMKFTHATPTLFYGGTPKPQMSSCFLLNCPDSLNGITECWKTCSFISKHAGGIGVDLSVRCKGSYIAGTNGRSNGIIPLIKVFNEIARYVDQCFTGNTMIYTKLGPKPIKEIGTFDEVMSGDGKFAKVKNLVRHNFNGKMLQIQTVNEFLPTITDLIMVTPNHQVFGLKQDEDSPKWRDMEELKEGDFLLTPYWQQNENTNDFITENDARFYGIMLGCGSLYDDPESVVLKLSGEFKQQHLEFIREYFADCGVQNVKELELDESTIQITATVAVPRFKFIRSHLYVAGTNDKTVHHSLLHLQQKPFRALLISYFQTQSWCKHEGDNKFTVGKMVGVNRHLRYALSYLFHRLAHTRDNMIVNANQDTCVWIKIWSQWLKHKITSIANVTHKDTTVYDFEVEEPHTYTVANFGAVHNGGGKRKGAISLYLQPWHPDIFEFLEVRFNTGPEEARARDIFPALWIPDLFFKRLRQDLESKWSLFCPGKFPELVTLYGDEFEKRYLELESQHQYEKQVCIKDIWDAILKSLMETGLPYMMAKDNVNNKSNHKNIGPITGSNLCTEIVQYHDANSTAVCNLASICLPRFVKDDGTFDFEELGKTVQIIVRNMNNIIDKNFYPEFEVEVIVPDENGDIDNPANTPVIGKKHIGRNNNFKYRPIGIGVQGLADVFAKMRFPWESEQAQILNQVIFETIYYNAVDKSMQLSQQFGAYSAFEGSPISQGLFQYNMWKNVVPFSHSEHEKRQQKLSLIPNLPLLDWERLRSDVVKFGVRNSLLLAPMPTASTSQIMGNTEAFEPMTSNLYIRKVGAGDFPVVNQHLYADLKRLGLWNKQMVDQIILKDGSVQHIPEIPNEIKQLYKTVWEIPQRIIVTHAANRGAFIDQTQSLNIFIARPTVSQLSSLYMTGWDMGLKTLSYYLRTKPATGAVKFTIMNEANPVAQPGTPTNNSENQTQEYKINAITGKKFICTEDVCTACSS